MYEGVVLKVRVGKPEPVCVENEEDYVRVVATSSGNNGGNKIKLWTRIQGRIACERELVRPDHFRSR